MWTECKHDVNHQHLFRDRTCTHIAHYVMLLNIGAEIDSCLSVHSHLSLAHGHLLEFDQSVFGNPLVAVVLVSTATHPTFGCTKYFGVYFVWSHAFVKFCSRFINVMALTALRKSRNELTALRLVDTYCLATLLFGREIVNLSDQNIHRFSVAWNCFFHILKDFGEKVSSLHCNFLQIFIISLFVGST